MDLNLEINGDLVLLPGGEIGHVTGWDEIRQSIIRALFTIPRQVLPEGTRIFPEYFFGPDYGLGITRMVGLPFGQAFKSKFTQKVRSAVTESQTYSGDTLVDTSKDPLIEYYKYGGGRIFTRITIPLKNGAHKELVFPVK